jgi:ADP-ribosylglycohydrolase
MAPRDDILYFAEGCGSIIRISPDGWCRATGPAVASVTEERMKYEM